MLVQAGAEAVNEGHCADVQGHLVHIHRTRAVSLQALRDDPQKESQHHVQSFRVAQFDSPKWILYSRENEAIQA
jgi:hypothetical protein